MDSSSARRRLLRQLSRIRCAHGLRCDEASSEVDVWAEG